MICYFSFTVLQIFGPEKAALNLLSLKKNSYTEFCYYTKHSLYLYKFYHATILIPKHFRRAKPHFVYKDGQCQNYLSHT